jgi:hypothetical protein
MHNSIQKAFTNVGYFTRVSPLGIISLNGRDYDPVRV